MSLSKDEEAQLVTLLKKLEPGFQPFEIFLQMARLNVLPIIEFVPLRMRDGKVEVLLLDREAWPHGLHTPGTVIRPTDIAAGNYQAFDRILKDELAGTEVSDPHYAGSTLHSSPRGGEQAQIFWVEVQGEPKAGAFYPADALPDDLIESQQKFIKLAVGDFKKHQ